MTVMWLCIYFVGITYSFFQIFIQDEICKEQLCLMLRNGKIWSQNLDTGEGPSSSGGPDEAKILH